MQFDNKTLKCGRGFHLKDPGRFSMNCKSYSWIALHPSNHFDLEICQFFYIKLKDFYYFILILLNKPWEKLPFLRYLWQDFVLGRLFIMTILQFWRLYIVKYIIHVTKYSEIKSHECLQNTWPIIWGTKPFFFVKGKLFLF